MLKKHLVQRGVLSICFQHVGIATAGEELQASFRSTLTRSYRSLSVRPVVTVSSFLSESAWHHILEKFTFKDCFPCRGRYM